MVYHEKALHTSNKYIFLQSQTTVVGETRGSRIPHVPQSINAEFILTKRENIADFQHYEWAKGTTCLVSQRFRLELQSDISPFTVFPRLPTKILLNAWNRLVYTILAKSYISRCQNLPRQSLYYRVLHFSSVESCFFVFFFFVLTENT